MSEAETKKRSACITVGKGAVGERGESAMLQHTRGPEDVQKLMVLRSAGGSLCPSTGVVASLVIDGEPVVSGSLTKEGGSIQFELAPGASIAAVVHTVPLNNGIVCIRLGNLEFHLDECDLV